MGVSMGLVLLIFGYLALSSAIIGLITWTLIAVLPPLKEEHPELYASLGRLSRQWLSVGAIAFLAGLLSVGQLLP